MEVLSLGCKLSPVDLRDYKICAGAQLPDSFELDFSDIKVKNQGSVSSCVAHAMSTILEYHAHSNYQLSTNFIYGIRKALYNQQGKGMYLRDACKIVANYGDPLLADCPGNNEISKVYEIAEIAMSNDKIMNTASAFRIKSYFSCNTIDEIKTALVNYGPVLISVKWFKDYKVVDGVLTGGNSEPSGYHALVCYGYTPEGLLIQNSWGKYWGDEGRFILPYSIKVREARGIVDLANDEYLPPKKPNKILNSLYKMLNTIINFVRDILKI